MDLQTIAYLKNYISKHGGAGAGAPNYTVSDMKTDVMDKPFGEDMWWEDDYYADEDGSDSKQIVSLNGYHDLSRYIKIKSLSGRTIKWTQLCHNANFDTQEGWELQDPVNVSSSCENNVLTTEVVTVPTETTSMSVDGTFDTPVAGHTYLLLCDVLNISDVDIDFSIRYGSIDVVKTISAHSEYWYPYFALDENTDGGYYSGTLYISQSVKEFSTGNQIRYRNVRIIDMTEIKCAEWHPTSMFDDHYFTKFLYKYAAEHGEYDAGSYHTADVSSVDVLSTNLFDDTQNSKLINNWIEYEYDSNGKISSYIDHPVFGIEMNLPFDSYINVESTEDYPSYAYLELLTVDTDVDETITDSFPVTKSIYDERYFISVTFGNDCPFEPTKEKADEIIRQAKIFVFDTDEWGSSEVDYSSPYKSTFAIPNAIRQLPGYGLSCGEYFNIVDFENKKYTQLVGLENGVPVVLDDPVEMSLSDILYNDFVVKSPEDHGPMYLLFSQLNGTELPIVYNASCLTYVSFMEFAQDAHLLDNKENITTTTKTFSGAPERNKRYICTPNYMSAITINSLYTDGIVDIFFKSGATPTVLTLPNTVKMPAGFSVQANTAYEINILDGQYAVVASWPL